MQGFGAHLSCRWTGKDQVAVPARCPIHCCPYSPSPWHVPAGEGHLQEGTQLIAGNLLYLELAEVIFQTRLIRLFFDQHHLLKQGQSLGFSTSRAVLGLSTCCVERRFVRKWQETTGGIVKTFSNTCGEALHSPGKAFVNSANKTDFGGLGFFPSPFICLWFW